MDYQAPDGAGVACVTGGDGMNDAVWGLGGCATAGGFFGQFLATSLVDRTNYGADTARQVYFVHEVRWGSSGAGYRLATAVIYSGPIGTTVDVGSFDGKLIGDLEALSFQGFVGSCPPTLPYAKVSACAEFAFQYNAHDEPVLCVWNELVGAGGSAGAFCGQAGGPFQSVIRQRLPVASFTGAATLATCPTPPPPDVPPPYPCIYSVSVDATASTDPDGAIVQYRWRCGGETIMVSATPTAQFTCVGAEVTLRVTDNAGGVDETNLAL